MHLCINAYKLYRRNKTPGAKLHPPAAFVPSSLLAHRTPGSSVSSAAHIRVFILQEKKRAPQSGDALLPPRGLEQPKVGRALHSQKLK